VCDAWAKSGCKRGIRELVRVPWLLAEEGVMGSRASVEPEEHVHELSERLNCC
jgi:hypothetical protein